MTQGQATEEEIEVLCHEELEDIGEASGITRRVALETENAGRRPRLSRWRDDTVLSPSR